MYWYNPTTRTSERVAAPSSEMQAIQMLAGTPDTAEFVKEYCALRRAGTPSERALVLVGHEFRLRQPEHQMVLSGRRSASLPAESVLAGFRTGH